MGYYRHGAYRFTEDLDMMMRIEHTPKFRAELERRRRDKNSVLTWTCKDTADWGVHKLGSGNCWCKMIKVHHKNNVFDSSTRQDGNVDLAMDVNIQIFEIYTVHKGVPIFSQLDSWFYNPPAATWFPGKSNVGKHFYERFWKGNLATGDYWADRTWLPETFFRNSRLGAMEFGLGKATFAELNDETQHATTTGDEDGALGIPLLTQVSAPALLTFENANWRRCCRGLPDGQDQQKSSHNVHCGVWSRGAKQKMPHLLTASLSLHQLLSHILCTTSLRTSRRSSDDLLRRQCARNVRQMLLKSLLRSDLEGGALKSEGSALKSEGLLKSAETDSVTGLMNAISSQLERAVVHLLWKVDPRSSKVREFTMDISLFIDSQTGEIAVTPGIGDDHVTLPALRKKIRVEHYDDTLYHPAGSGLPQPTADELYLPKDASVDFTDVNRPHVRHVVAIYTTRQQMLPLEVAGVYKAKPFWDESLQSYLERKLPEFLTPGNWTAHLIGKHKKELDALQAQTPVPTMFDRLQVPGGKEGTRTYEDSRIDGFARSSVSGAWSFCRHNSCEDVRSHLGPFFASAPVGAKTIAITPKWFPTWSRYEIGYEHRKWLLVLALVCFVARFLLLTALALIAPDFLVEEDESNRDSSDSFCCRFLECCCCCRRTNKNHAYVKVESLPNVVGKSQASFAESEPDQNEIELSRLGMSDKVRFAPDPPRASSFFFFLKTLWWAFLFFVVYYTVAKLSWFLPVD